MNLEFSLSKDSILELGKVVQESVKKEIKSLFPEYLKKPNEEQVLLNRQQACK